MMLQIQISTQIGRFALGSALALVMAVLSGCSSFSNAGPRSSTITSSEGKPFGPDQIRVVKVDSEVTEKLLRQDARPLFSAEFPSVQMGLQQLSSGDVVDISIWEAAPAVLFAPALNSNRDAVGAPGNANFPQLEIDVTGQISVPFVGLIQAKGMTVAQLQNEIVRRLRGRANQPQVQARIARNQSASVTVLGEFVSPGRMPLTARGERLLDVIAGAGGVRQPVNKTTIQMTRGGRTAVLSFDQIIQDPSQNVSVQPGDVITALFQPFSFTALGAFNESKEIPFEGVGITLSQALGRMGGLKDDRANPTGVFLFRFEKPNVVDALGQGGGSLSRVPVIYHFDLKKAESLFLVQNFKVHNGDLIYAANAPVADLQKILNMFSTVIFSAAGVNNLTQ